MRLRNIPGAHDYLTSHPLVIKNETRFRGSWKETFSNPENPIHIEIGMGKGQFITQMAINNPRIFLTIHILPATTPPMDVGKNIT